MSSLRRHLASLWLPGLSACFGAAPEPTPPPEPHGLADVVVITLDTTRADHLGAYGYPRPTSPTFDALAASSLRFTRLVVPMATTLPTHTSLFTATWPDEHGVLANVRHGGDRFVARPGLGALAVWLKSIGYRSGGFVSAEPLARSSGIAAGFDTYDQPARIERPAAQTIAEALAWMPPPDGPPMLLWVHLYDPHNPFTPPDDAVEAVRSGTDAAALSAWLDARAPASVARRPTGQVVRLARDLDLYDGEIRSMDAALATLIDALRDRGRWDDTLLIVMGDHGEGLNQHGVPGHGLVWMEQLHAPLLLRAPGTAPAVVDTVLSAADVLPTALGLVDLPGEEAFLAQATGIDVLSDPTAGRAVVSRVSERQVDLGGPRTWALTTAAERCVWDEGGEGTLYDLAADPHELVPLQAPERLAACVASLQAAIADQRARGRSLGEAGSAPTTPEELQALQALGYIDGDDE